MTQKDDFKKKKNGWPAISCDLFNRLRYNSFMDSVIKGASYLIGDDWYVKDKKASLVHINPLIHSIFLEIEKDKKEPPTEKYVYLFCQENDSNKIKVGVTHDLDERRKVIQRSSGMKTVLFFSSQKMSEKTSRKIETMFKTKHRKQKLEGDEWFGMEKEAARESLQGIIDMVETESNLLEFFGA